MLDTIKVGIPLMPSQHKRIQAVGNDQDRWQWIQFNPVLGELRFVRASGLVKTDSHSYHRELRWEVDQTWSEECKLWLEFSIPKFWYGHNIHLLYDFLSALRLLKGLLDDLFELKGKVRLPDPAGWLLYRVDLCYAWRFPSQVAAQQYLDSLKHVHYPRKKPSIHPTSIIFVGTTYSFKFYLKLPEFRVHDLKELRRSKASIEWMNHLEALADSVLRCEVTLRRKWLLKNELTVVSHLQQPINQLHWDTELIQSEGFNPALSMAVCLKQWGIDRNIDLDAFMVGNTRTPLTDGMRFETPAAEWSVLGTKYFHPGGGFTLRVEDRLNVLLQTFIDKYLGSEVKMLEANQVQAKLLETYKPVKAARLVSLWLYVQRFGTDQAKQTFGENSYYRSKRELKQAGVSLIEGEKLVTTVDSEFLRNFAPTVPSPHVVNAVDDFRDKSNILNFVPKVSGMY